MSPYRSWPASAHTPEPRTLRGWLRRTRRRFAVTIGGTWRRRFVRCGQCKRAFGCGEALRVLGVVWMHEPCGERSFEGSHKPEDGSEEVLSWR